MAFIMAFLLVLPGIGEVAEGVDTLAQIAQIVRGLEFAGNTAQDIYGVVEGPISAPMAIAGLLFGGLALRDDFVWEAAAKVSRCVGKDVVESLGKTVSEGVAKVKQTVKECR